MNSDKNAYFLSLPEITELSVPPKTILLEEGKVADRMYLIRKGCLRLFFNNEGRDITFQFFFEGDFVASFDSLYQRTPSLFSLESIEPAELSVMKREDFFRNLGQKPALRQIYEEKIIERFHVYQRLFLSRIKNTPQQRYEELLKEHPSIIQRIPQHYIASYLGITSVSLSRSETGDSSFLYICYRPVPVEDANFAASIKTERQMKKIFIIDWSLIPVFVLSAYSGIELHVADYEGNHEVWHNWAVFHVLTSLLFLMASIFHIATHWGWYKGTAKNGIGRKSKVTAVLSVLFLSVVLTGFALLGIEGAGSPVGQCHFWAGIVTTVLSIGHILKRLPLLRKSLK